jgi:hypothetical protein
MTVLFFKAAEREDSSPNVGDKIRFLSDLHTDKGPSGGVVTDAKITVDGLYLRIKHSDEERLFSWDDIKPGARKTRHGWMIKAQPTPAQAEAGNYKKRHRRFRGLDITIESPAGSVREGAGPNGKRWRTKMRLDYGYIRRTEGTDGDHVDCYIGPDEEAPHVYVVHQRKAGDWKAYDEDKAMLGFRTKADAVRAYLAHYDDKRFLGPVTTMPFDEFKAKALATLEKPKMIKAVLFRKARDPADRHTLDMFGAGTHIEARTRKDGVVQGYHVGAAAPASAVQPAAAAPPKPSARAVAALRILEAGGRFSEALERGYGGREQLAMRLLDARGRPVKGFGYKTYQELRDARRLRRMPGPQGSALRSNWALDRGEEQQSAPPASPAARPTTYTVGGGTHPGGTYREEGPDPSEALPAGQSRKFYASVYRDGQGFRMLAGPFDTHEEALAHVDAARTKAHEVDRKSAFDAFGTSSYVTKDGEHVPGILNGHLGL